MTDRTRNRRDGGSATIWVIAACALLVVLGGAGTLRAAAVLARHRAEAAADLSAVAAAAGIGTGGEPCAAAGRVASRNGAALEACRLRLDGTGRSGSVDVVVRMDIRLPVVGRRSVRASARAGRRPIATQARDTAGRPPIATQAPDTADGALGVPPGQPVWATAACGMLTAGRRPGDPLSNPPGRRRTGW